MKSYEIPQLELDAISINQSDIDERNYQVRLMKGVYSCCMADLIWFGEAKGDTELVLATELKALDLQRIAQRTAVKIRSL